jgi:A/G-specific adenine glycosylase
MDRLPEGARGINGGGRYTPLVAKHRKTNLLRESANPLPTREELDWFRDRVTAWAAENGRDFPWRHTGDEYRIVVTEILLQQTTAAAVAKLYDGFFTQFPTWQALHKASPDELCAAISKLGLGNQRTARLKSLADWVGSHGWALPATRDELEDVPGVGQYVASALLAIKYGESEPLLDVNMARVLERFFAIRELADIRDDPWLQTTARLVAPTMADSWSLLDLGAATCVARKPSCSTCPVVARCSCGSELVALTRREQ